ncbi:MAG TPA: GlsB/YeaQ/YmgE family stress response membrane protein [Pirellulales bacterium]|nr:GlsB/YeaQ/YmgE family stress response membrane protein [Pirellulales bacterium]
MPPETTSALEHVANNVLVWVGFGMLAGMIAKAIMPGRDPGGPIATLLTGCGGSVVGSGTLMYFWSGQRVPAISPLGFAVATGGAFILLFFYRLLSGRIIREDGEGFGTIGRVGRPYYQRRRSRRSIYEE